MTALGDYHLIAAIPNYLASSKYKSSSEIAEDSKVRVLIITASKNTTLSRSI